MVKILEITTIRSSCCIRLDNGEQYWIRRNDVSASFFREGSEMDYDAFLQQIRICQYPHALNHAILLLARRPYSKKEIITRLVRLRYTDEVARLVVYRLEKDKLLNDQEFCNQWIRIRLSGSVGRSIIRRELLMKGIPVQMIDEAFASLSPGDEQEGADVLARKLWKRIGADEDRRRNRQKVIVSIVRKGYSWDTARAACEKAEKELY